MMWLIMGGFIIVAIHFVIYYLGVRKLMLWPWLAGAISYIICFVFLGTQFALGLGR